MEMDPRIRVLDRSLPNWYEEKKFLKCFSPTQALPVIPLIGI